MDRYSMNFGKKERVLNYTCQTYQLSRPNKVGAVMALIRHCQPSSFDEWQSWYFENAHTAGKNPTKITVESLHELGERLYAKITEVVIPEWEAAFRELTEQDCIDYIYNLTINRTYDGYIREKSVINDGLVKAIGIQIKPITASANFGSYSLTERMKVSFESFKERYGGNVFIVFSLDGEIANKEVIGQIQSEIDRLSN